MLYLLLTILLNTTIFVSFKIFERWNINSLQAIIANYCTCTLIGTLLHGSFPIGAGSVEHDWLPWSILMGAMFISVFNLIAYCTQKDGITTTTVANKLSLIIPVVFSFFLYKEHIGVMKIAGIVISIPAIYFTTRVKEEDNKAQNIWIPMLLFVGSGLLDTLIKFVEQAYLPDSASVVIYTIHVFATASLIGVALLSYLVLRGKTTIGYRNIVAGVLLGIPNYFSIYFLVLLLNSGFMQSSAAIPVNNIGILVASALCAILFFKEKISPLRIIGLILSVAAILLIAFGDLDGRHI